MKPVRPHVQLHLSLFTPEQLGIRSGINIKHDPNSNTLYCEGGSTWPGFVFIFQLNKTSSPGPGYHGYYEAGYQLGLLSPALSFMVCARSNQRAFGVI